MGLGYGMLLGRIGCFLAIECHFQWEHGKFFGKISGLEMSL